MWRSHASLKKTAQLLIRGEVSSTSFNSAHRFLIAILVREEKEKLDAARQDDWFATPANSLPVIEAQPIEVTSEDDMQVDNQTDQPRPVSPCPPKDHYLVDVGGNGGPIAANRDAEHRSNSADGKIASNTRSGNVMEKAHDIRCSREETIHGEQENRPKPAATNEIAQTQSAVVNRTAVEARSDAINLPGPTDGKKKKKKKKRRNAEQIVSAEVNQALNPALNLPAGFKSKVC